MTSVAEVAITRTEAPCNILLPTISASRTHSTARYGVTKDATLNELNGWGGSLINLSGRKNPASKKEGES